MALLQSAAPTGVEGSTMIENLRDAAFRTFARWRTRPIVDGLSNAQLKDGGIDGATIMGELADLRG